MVGRTLATLLLASCGRIGFDSSELIELDAPACIAIGHDEDADGVDDACDVCPQTADVAQADRDGDRVGDACDPHPDDAIDTIVAFDPFTSQRPEWTFPGAQPTFTGDSMIGDARMGQFRADRAGVPATDTYTFAVQLRRANANGQRQLALYAIEDDALVYFCDLDDNVNGRFWAQSFTTNGTDFGAGDASDSTGPLENGSLLIALTHDVAAWSCVTTWPVDKPVLTGPIPSGITPLGISLSSIRLEIEVTSFLHVHAN